MALQGFDREFYLDAKLEALQAEYPEWVGKTRADLEQTLEQAGFTAESHYQVHGYLEGLSPNAYFDESEYVYAKATQMFDQGFGASIAEAIEIFTEAWPTNPYDHYIAHGGSEGINPSNDFDSSSYLEAKLAQMQADDPALYGDWTVDQVDQAIQDAGLTPLGHYFMFGIDEGVVPVVVPEDEQVFPDGPEPGPVGDGTNFVLNPATAAGADVMELTGDMDVRIDFTDPSNQVVGLDLDGDGTIRQDGVENNITGVAADFEIVNAYGTNRINQFDFENNFLGDIDFDGTGFDGDGVATNGNIFLGGLGVDRALGGIGNDFLVGGGVAANQGSDSLFGGRNADFFFGEISQLDFTDGNDVWISGGFTTDDSAVGDNTAQDRDWLLLEVSDDEDGTIIDLRNDDNSGYLQFVRSGSSGSIEMWLREIENFDGSGNLYGFVDDVDVALGGNGMIVDGENVGIGSTAQLQIIGSDVVDNIFIGGFDNDRIQGNGGDDLLFGGNLNYNNNPNTQNIVNDGMDFLDGGAGDDGIVFEADGGAIDGGAGNDTLFVTDLAMGTSDAASMINDGVLRFDLAAENLADAAGFGGADVDGTQDQSNYADTDSRVTVTGMENVIATGLGAVDYKAAGSNDPDLVFNNQQNHFAYDGNMDLRGTYGASVVGVDINGDGRNDWPYFEEAGIDNILYASSGDDTLEGRTGNDLLSGGEGNDTFEFTLGARQGDGLDIIHRQTDADGDNIWDVDADGNVLYERDFLIESTTEFGPSNLSVDFAAANLADVNVFMDAFSVVIGAETFAVTDLDALEAVTTVEALATLANEAFQAQDANVSVTAVGNQLTITDATPAGGRDISDTQLDGYDVSISVIAPGSGALGLPVYTAPGETVSQDQLSFVAYENRFDNERIDDDAIFGADSLGVVNYAQDLVADFDVDGSTVLAENQNFQVDLENLAVEDIVTITVNDVNFTLQVGKAADGSLIAAETTQAFASRLGDYINDFLDDDTAAGKVDAFGGGFGDIGYVNLSQAAYDGEETVFMNVSVDVDDNSSNGEGATASVDNHTSTEVTLFQFDGRDGELNADTVEFVGDTGTSRAVFATAEVAGGDLFGSDAIVINVDDASAINSSATEGIDGAEIFFNAEENLTTGETEDYAVHGDDQLFGDDGDDNIAMGTGDDRAYFSRGADTIDGGKEIYNVDGELRVLNAYEANLVDADPAVISIEQVANTSFDDTLILQQSDFGVVGVDGATFTIDLDQYEFSSSVVGDDTIVEVGAPHGGAGTAQVFEAGDVTGTTVFTNFENVRTVAGDGSLEGQGNDTLILTDISGNTGGAGFDFGDSFVRFDANADFLDPEDTDADSDILERSWQELFKVDGVENIIGGTGEDRVVVDETEMGKNNSFELGAATDEVVYENNSVLIADLPTVTFTVNAGDDVDTLASEGGVLLAGDVPVDTLSSVEIVDARAILRSTSADDVLDVTNVNDAVIDFANNEIRANGDLVNDLGDEEVILYDLDEFEIFNADYADTVILSDRMINANAADNNEELQFDSVLNYDTVVGTDRQSIADLRSTGGALPEWDNIGLYTFNMGEGAVDVDTMDYSNDGSDITAVVTLEDTTATVNHILVDEDDMVFDRVDVLNDVEVIAASAGNSTLDLTSATSGLQVRYNVDDGASSNVAELDRDVFTIQLTDMDTSVPVTGTTFVEYYDAGVFDIGDAEVINQQTAAWNTVEGGDFGEKIELTDHETLEDHTFNLRGGENEVNYNELTRSIQATFDVVAYDELDPTNTGLITADLVFTDGNNVIIGGDDSITSYSAQNGIAEGSLRIEASQDAEDRIAFADATLEKLFILGEVIDGSDQITVKLGSDDAENSLELTGFEQLQDSASDDEYRLFDMDRVINNLTLVDNTIDDTDTVIVGDDATGYGAAPADTISLQAINDDLNFDFDILDVTNVTDNNLILVGDAGPLLGSPSNYTNNEPANDNAATTTEILGDGPVTVTIDDIGLADSDNDFFAVNLIEGRTYQFDGVAGTLSDPEIFLFDIDGTTLIDSDDDGGIFLNSQLIYTAASTGTYYIDAREFGDNGDDGDYTLSVTELRDLLNDVVLVGDLDLIDDVQLFPSIAFTDASITSAGDIFTIDIDAGELIDGDSNVLFTFDASLTKFDFSAVTSGVTVDVVDVAGVGVEVIGGSGDDVITGGSGNDIITGGAGADVLEGGTATEVRQFNITGVLASDGNEATFNFMSQGNLILTENTPELVDGAGNDAVGTALADLLTADLAATNADWLAGGGDLGSEIVGITYDDVTDQLEFTFETGIDVAAPIDLGYAANGDGGSLGVSLETVISEGGDGGADTFVFTEAGDSVAGSVDTINEFDAAADRLDFSALELVDNGGDVTTLAEAMADGGSFAANEDFAAFDDTDESTLYVDADESAEYDAGSDMEITITGDDRATVAAYTVGVEIAA